MNCIQWFTQSKWSLCPLVWSRVCSTMNCMYPATPGPTKVRLELVKNNQNLTHCHLDHFFNLIGDRTSQCRGELHRNPAYSPAAGDVPNLKANGMTVLLSKLW